MGCVFYLISCVAGARPSETAGFPRHLCPRDSVTAQAWAPRRSWTAASSPLKHENRTISPTRPRVHRGAVWEPQGATWRGFPSETDTELTPRLFPHGGMGVRTPHGLPARLGVARGASVSGKKTAPPAAESQQLNVFLIYVPFFGVRFFLLLFGAL